jgi:hypothetical protein
MTAGTYQNLSRANKERFARFRRDRGRVTFCFSLGLIFRAICLLLEYGEQSSGAIAQRRLIAPDCR